MLNVFAAQGMARVNGANKDDVVGGGPELTGGVANKQGWMDPERSSARPGEIGPSRSPTTTLPMGRC